MCQDNNKCAGLIDVVKTILKLQDFDDCCGAALGCDRPFLGPTPTVVCYNTRPVTLYNCTTGDLWELPYTFNGATGTSTVFRLESIDENCVTCRILIPATEPTDVSPYTATESFFTINLRCVAAIKCLPDVYVPCN